MSFWFVNPRTRTRTRTPAGLPGRSSSGPVLGRDAARPGSAGRRRVGTSPVPGWPKPRRGARRAGPPASASLRPAGRYGHERDSEVCPASLRPAWRRKKQRRSRRSRRSEPSPATEAPSWFRSHKLQNLLLVLLLSGLSGDHKQPAGPYRHLVSSSCNSTSTGLPTHQSVPSNPFCGHNSAPI